MMRLFAHMLGLSTPLLLSGLLAFVSTAQTQANSQSIPAEKSATSLSLNPPTGSITVTQSNANYTVLELPSAAQLRLFWSDERGRVFKRFETLARWLDGRGQSLVFAMNAGMYHYDFSPVGLLQIDGKVWNPVNHDGGYGNFFLKPNGVLAWSKDSVAILETSEYPARAHEFSNATQSGPLLLRHAQIHPSFDPASPSKHIRNGVGIRAQGLVFVISNRPVSFYEFAAFFRDELQCNDALYLDGSISSLYSLALNRHDRKTDLGPILGVAVSKFP
ncbi:phosphodiester glycosidase family protein [Undibacterium cyanobacteriorum]|uniref:Phosphodiester glycosidase family protein n=1 Tax=Undibacterium cyanobacteriorum TaxID=3073561 RepID=A0ABY9RK44_9BURK|nr:phosphodiester glycosidase family protein [Undibacterium sp. 20NA77.5]WMW80742.1 phosphodiester glycosidase family protein [Undibacterium sp. 20NA77.5]